MSYGPISVFTTIIASGASTSSNLDLSRAWNSVKLRVGTMSTGSVIRIYGTEVDGGTYYQLYHPSINSSTVTNNPFLISATVGSGGGIVEIPGGMQYIRFVTTGVVSGGVSFKVICSD